MGKIAILFFLTYWGSSGLRAQETVWALGFGGSSADIGRSVVTDPMGNVYTAGTFQGTVDFDPGPDSFMLASRGGYDLFISKMDASGKLMWAVSMGTGSTDYAYAVATDDSGNVYATGYFSDRVDFDPGPDSFHLVSEGTYDIFVLKLDASGKFLWARSMGGTKADYGYSIAVDKKGNVFTAGYFNGEADFNPATGPADTFILYSNGLADIFVSKLDPSGNFLWANKIGEGSSEYCNGITTDAWGNFYITGYFQATVDFDPGPANVPLTARGGSTDAYVAKYNNDGQYLWAKSMGGSGADQGWSVAADPAGNVVATGYFLSTADFNPGPDSFKLKSPGGQDIYVAKWDSSGSFLWAGQMGGTSGDYGYAVATDGAGNIYTTGRFAATADFDPGSDSFKLTTYGGTDLFISKLDPSGNFIWARNMGGTGSTDYGYGITVDRSGNVYATGQFSGTAEFGSVPGDVVLTTKGGTDIFTMKIGCSDTSSSALSATADCNGYLLNGILYLETGIYEQKHPNILGCDSIIVLDLTITTLDPVITVNEFVLGTAVPYATYQWYKNDILIPGATDSTYTVTENAGYFVAVTDENGCPDTSDVYVVSNVTAINDRQALGYTIDVFPNPVKDQLYIRSAVPVGMTLSTIEGRVLFQSEDAKVISLEHLPQGIYLLRLTDKDGRRVETRKIVKE